MRPKPSLRTAKKEPEKQALKKHQVAKKYDEGHAQKRLGEIYETGGPVKRDYAMALRWYEKARAHGIEVPNPHAYPRATSAPRQRDFSPC